MASFWLDRVFWPHSLFAFNLTNLVMHLMAGTVAALLACTLFRLAGNRSHTARWLGFWTGAFFLIEPMQVATVLYTVQRMAVLAALFMLAGVWSYLEARLRSREGRPAGLWFLLALLLCPLLAVFSKENGALTPVLELASELLFFRFQAPPRIRRMLFAYFGFLTALALALVGLALFDRGFIRAGYPGRGFTLSTRLLTESRVLVRYIVMPFWPTARRISFFHDDIALSQGFLTPPSTAFSCFILTALAGLALALWKRRPLVSFGLCWFFIGQLLESTFIPLEIMFIHRNYLPVFGLLLAAVDALWAALALLARLRWADRIHVPLHRLGSLIPVPLFALLAFLSFHQASLWGHPLRFYQASFHTHPQSPSALSGLAQIEFSRGHGRTALTLLEHSSVIGAGVQADVYRCLIRHRLQARELAPGLIPLHAPHLSAYPITALNHLAILGLTGHCHYSRRNFLVLLERAQSAQSLRTHNRFLLAIYLGYEYERLRHTHRALEALATATRDIPGSPIPWILGARWLIRSGQREQARHWLARARLRLANAPALVPDWEALTRSLDQPNRSRPQPVQGG